MIKPEQDEFYKLMGEKIGKLMDKKDLSIYQTSRLGGIQYNTVEAMLDGKPFRGHQYLWIRKVLGVSLDKLFTEITQKMTIGKNHGEEIKKESSEENSEENSEESCESFI